MAFFKKKQTSEEISGLPELPSFSEMQEIKDAIKPESSAGNYGSRLPSLPQFSRESRKDTSAGTSPAISSLRSSEPEESEMPLKSYMAPKDYSPSISDNLQPAIAEFQPSSIHEIPEPSRAEARKLQYPQYNVQEPQPQVIVSQPLQSSRTQRGPIFVKIDKFREAAAAFEMIKRKISELDDILKKTKEVRDKEMQEFDEWEQEINEIKEKIRKIDDKLFSGLEY